MNRELLTVTTDTLPIAHEIDHVWSMVSCTAPIEVSSKGVVRGLLERGRNEQQEAFDRFLAAVPAEANAVVGVRVSTAMGQFGATVHLLITYVGTPVKYRPLQG
jgi:uncharacterized protein YbjQ (UPF0145 family)